MHFYNLAALALANSIIASPISTTTAINSRAALDELILKHNLTFVSCNKTSTDPNCAQIKSPIPHVLSSILLEDGTWSDSVKSNWTREALADIRKVNNVTSNAPNAFDPVAHQAKMKRETPAQICHSEQMTWWDAKYWGYWYQPWAQVGNCFYGEDGSDAIAVGFSVTDTWTTGLSITFDKIISATFSFAYAQQTTLTETRTCLWKKGSEHGCHSIWYQPLMQYHDGFPNYQTHTHCPAGLGQRASDTYYDHQWAVATVNQAGTGGVNLGNLGCNSGCQGKDFRQCLHGNNGGMLWAPANP